MALVPNNALATTATSRVATCHRALQYGICFSGGYHETKTYTKTNIIQKITIQTTGNATDFGDLTQASIAGAQFSDGTTGVIASGEGATLDDRMDKITIGTPGNATDFGNLITNNTYLGGPDGVSGAAS